MDEQLVEIRDGSYHSKAVLAPGQFVMRIWDDNQLRFFQHATDHNCVKKELYGYIWCMPIIWIPAGHKLVLEL